MPRARTLSDEVVLERAMAVFWQNGYAGTSLRDLTRATGLSTAALYHRYADKDGLFVAVLHRYAEEGLVARIARLAGTDPPLAAISGFFDELIAASLADPHRRGCLLVNTALDGAAVSEAARRLVRERFASMEAFFADCLRRAVAAGALAADTDVAAAATALLGAVFALRVLVRLDADPARLRAVADQAVASLPRARPARRPRVPKGARP